MGDMADMVNDLSIDESGWDRSVHFSSQSNEWATPQELFDRLYMEFLFTLDPCATKQNAKCANYFTAEQNGLAQKWEGTVFVNPPYGKELKHWVKKSSDEAANGCMVVMLIPARTDTAYWHAYIQPILQGTIPGEVRFLKGRVKFIKSDGKTGPAPFPSAIVVFHPRFKESLAWK